MAAGTSKDNCSGIDTNMVLFPSRGVIPSISYLSIIHSISEISEGEAVCSASGKRVQVCRASLWRFIQEIRHPISAVASVGSRRHERFMNDVVESCCIIHNSVVRYRKKKNPVVPRTFASQTTRHRCQLTSLVLKSETATTCS
jgi:hypothetical protein